MAGTAMVGDFRAHTGRVAMRIPLTWVNIMVGWVTTRRASRVKPTRRPNVGTHKGEVFGRTACGRYG